GLGQLAALIDSARGSGFACELRTLGEPIALTPGVDLVVYRVIEALLSAARHRCSGTIATLRYQPHELELEIRSDRSIPDLDEQLRAIAQRVALYDGSLQTLPASSGGVARQGPLPLAGGGAGCE